LEARYDYYRGDDRVQAEITREQMEGIRAQIARKWERIADLEVKAPSNGRLVLPKPRDLPGRFVQKGQLLGYIIADGRISVRAVATQDDIDLIRSRTRYVEVRRTEAIDEIVPARIVSEVPTANMQLPSAALGIQGGGIIPTDPRDEEGATALARLFQLELTLPQDMAPQTIGSRIFVRFEHPPEPIAFRWYRGLRRLFLSYFDV
jgi:putative peptide zinc metalloprotease protein